MWSRDRDRRDSLSDALIFGQILTTLGRDVCYLHDGGVDGGTEGIVCGGAKPALCLPPRAPPIYSPLLATPFKETGTSEV